MAQTRFIEKRKIVVKERKAEKLHYRLLIGLMALNVLHYLFLEPKLVGHDKRYITYISILPTLVGIVALVIYRYKFLLSKYKGSKGVILKTFVICFYFIQGILFSYLSLGFIAKVSWNYLNQREAENNLTESMIFKVDKILTGRKPKVEFSFQNRFESIPVSYQSIKEFKSKNFKALELRVRVQKGLWNYYVVKDWHISDVR